MTSESSARLADMLRIQRYHRVTAEQALGAAPLAPPVPGAGVAADWQTFTQQIDRLLALCDPLAQVPAADPETVAAALAAAEPSYQALRAGLLQAAATGELAIAAMETALRRAAQQAAKAHRHRHGPGEADGATEAADTRSGDDA